jgi:aconitate hydratase
MLRKHGVVGRFVEYYGPGLASLTLADRATLANMAPEYGATCGFFGIDDKTLDYLRLTGRAEEKIALVEAYAKEQGFWIDPAVEPVFSSTLELDIGTVVPSLAGPKRPQDRVDLTEVDDVFNADMTNTYKKAQQRVPGRGQGLRHRRRRRDDRRDHQLHQHLEPRRAGGGRSRRQEGHELGLKPKPWVKTSLAPGSQVVTDYLNKAGLQSTSTISASTSSAMAARPASATPAPWPSRSARRSTTTASSPPP